MFVAAGQFAVGPSWEKNAETCASLMSQAAGEGVSLLVLPEALLARNDIDPDLSVKSAQLLEGGFLTRLLRESAQNEMTTILTIHVPSVRVGLLTCWWRCGEVGLLPIMQNCIFTTRLRFRSREMSMQETP